MKSQILKIAGVKTEKEFYKKYPSEEAFMKVHGKAFKKAQTGAAIEKAQLGADINKNGIPDYLENTGSNQNQYTGTGNIQQQFGSGINTSNFGPQNDPNYTRTSFPKPQVNTDYYDPSSESGLQYQQYTPSQESIAKENQQITGDVSAGASEKSPGGGLDASAIVGMASTVGNVFNAFASQKKQKKALQQQNKLLGLTETLSKSTDVNEPYQKHVNDRPENYMASTNSFYPSKGTGYDILRATRDGGYIKAQSGRSIGGNPTEIQNTYDPYDIYSDGGYEPMNDSDKVKTFQEGGGVGNAVSGQVSGLIGQGFNNSAGYQAGEALGGVSDLIFPGSGVFTRPLLGLAGGIADQLYGDAGDINKLTKQNEATQGRIMDNSMWKGMGQFGSVRQEGGYLNPEYNPQVITMFGDHNAKDFADYAHKYRSGGHLKEYTAPSERAMETYADGGEVTSHNLGETQVESGGYLKPISYNPHNDGTGWTSKIEGQYHSDYDPKLGHSGVIFNHGNNQVEAERGELIRHVQEGDSVDGKEGKLSANITGNLVYEPIFGDEDSKYKKYEKMKIKNIHEDIANQDARLNKKEFQINDKISNLNSEGNDSYSKLKQTSLDMMKKGIDQQYAVNAEAADYFTNHQTKVNDLVDQMSKLHGKEFSHEKFAKKGILSDVLAKGEISQAAAKNGKTLYKAAYGTTTDETTIPIGNVKSTEAMETVPKGQRAKGKYYGNVTDESYAQLRKNNPWFEWDKFDPSKKGEVKRFQKEFNLASKLTGSKARLTEDDLLGQQTASAKVNLNNGEPVAATVTPPAATTTPATTTKIEPVEETKKGAPWLSAATSLLRGFQPAFNMPIGSQINPELYAMADNNVEGLNEPHMYSMLETPYKYSADRDRNAILSQARQAVKNAGNNPAAQAAIMAQVADSMGQVSSREGDINQQQYQGVYNRNIGTVNQDRARNLGIDIDSAMKLSQAKSNLQAKKLAAMTSAEAKIAANKRENMEYNIGMAEHPDFTFGPDGRIIKLPRYVDFDTSGKGVASNSKQSAPEGFEYLYDSAGNIKTMKSKKEDDKAKNGKSIKTKSANSNVVRAFKGF